MVSAEGGKPPAENLVKDVVAAVLAGGLGTRLRPVVSDRPKVLAAVHGRPFLSYVLDQLAAAGVLRVVLCTGYLGEQVHRVFGSRWGAMELIYSRETAPLGTGGALRKALPHLSSNPVLVMNGDAFCGIQLADFYAWHCRRGARATLAIVQASDAARYGRVQVDATGEVVRFAEKCAGPNVAWINAGIYLLDRSIIENVSTGYKVSLEREVFPRWIGKGFYGYSCEGGFLDIGTPQSYVDAKKFFASEGPGRIPSSAMPLKKSTPDSPSLN